MAAADTWMDSSNPLDHVTAAAEASSTGNKELTCKHCEKTFNGGASRAYVHLTGDGKGVAACKKIPARAVTKLKAGKAKKTGDNKGVKRSAAEALGDRHSSHAAAGPGPSSLQAQKQMPKGQQSVR
jgi:hypothetical protein